MNNRRHVILGLLGSFCWPLLAGAQTQPLIERIRQRLVDVQVLRGHFEQRKSVKGFRNPLLSRGVFSLDKGRGMLWDTHEPFESRLILSRDKMRVQRPDGRLDTRLDATKDPSFREISTMLLAFMSTDLDILNARFRIEGQLNEARTDKFSWRLKLVPREAVLAQWVARIELGGDSYLNEIRWQESRGDVTHIVLSGHAIESSLSAEEIALFE